MNRPHIFPIFSTGLIVLATYLVLQATMPTRSAALAY